MDHVMVGWREARPAPVRRLLLNLLGLVGVGGAIALTQVVGGAAGCVGLAVVFFGAAYALGIADDPRLDEHQLLVSGTGLRWTGRGRTWRLPWHAFETIARRDGELWLVAEGKAERLGLRSEASQLWLHHAVERWRVGVPELGGEVDAALMAMRERS